MRIVTYLIGFFWVLGMGAQSECTVLSIEIKEDKLCIESKRNERFKTRIDDDKFELVFEHSFDNSEITIVTNDTTITETISTNASLSFAASFLVQRPERGERIELYIDKVAGVFVYDSRLNVLRIKRDHCNLTCMFTNRAIVYE